MTHPVVHSSGQFPVGRSGSFPVANPNSDDKVHTFSRQQHTKPLEDDSPSADAVLISRCGGEGGDRSPGGRTFYGEHAMHDHEQSSAAACDGRYSRKFCGPLTKEGEFSSFFGDDFLDVPVLPALGEEFDATSSVLLREIALLRIVAAPWLWLSRQKRGVQWGIYIGLFLFSLTELRNSATVIAELYSSSAGSSQSPMSWKSAPTWLWVRGFSDVVLGPLFGAVVALSMAINTPSIMGCVETLVGSWAEVGDYAFI